MQVRQTIAVFGGQSTRRAGAPLAAFVDRYRKKLAGFHILTAQGAAQEVFGQYPSGTFDLEVVRRGEAGGFIQIANAIVEGKCKAVVFFSGPGDKSFESYTSGILVNQGIWHDRELLFSPATAEAWITGTSGITDPASETLALIAHSATADRNPKADLLEFSRTNQNLLDRFERLICTGTTGRELGEGIPALSGKLYAFQSGMRGGDVQIANEIVEGRCKHVIFYINPQWAQPHSTDVRMFLDVCRVMNVNVLITHASSVRWITSLRQQLGV
jgi:methylglyoxal synthase